MSLRHSPIVQVPRRRWRGWACGALLGLTCAAAAAQTGELEDLPDFGDSAGAVISPEQEVQLGLATMRQIRRYAPIITDEEVEDYIQKLGKELGDQSHYYGDFHFFVIQSDVVNAFAVPGGYIGMHSGLILGSKSESEVASVLAHEISHLTQRHGARMIEAAKNMSIPTMAAFIGAIALAAVAPQVGLGAIAGVAAAQQQYQIDFTRANEKEADRIGIELLSKSGFRTLSMADFFERLQLANRYSDPRMIPEFLRTHPVTVNRIAEARERAERLPSKVVREDSYDFLLIWQKLNVLSMSDPAQARNYYEAVLRDKNYTNEAVVRYGYVLALTEGSEFVRARRELAGLLRDNPNLTAFRMAQARIEERAGNRLLALDLYRQLHKLDPTSRAAAYSYVALLNHTRNGAAAKELLRGFGSAEQREPRFYKLLAEAELLLGEKANSHYDLAEYYRALGEIELSAEQLRLGQVVPGLTHYQRLRLDARLEELERELNRLDQDRAKRREREERRRQG